MYLVGFFDRILKYCLSSDISRKKVFFDSPNNEMEKENCRCRFWSNSWSKMGHGVELLDLGHLMVLSHSMHFLDIKGVAHARQRWTLIVSIPCGINKLPNRVSLLNTLRARILMKCLGGELSPILWSTRWWRLIVIFSLFWRMPVSGSVSNLCAVASATDTRKWPDLGRSHS